MAIVGTWHSFLQNVQVELNNIWSKLGKCVKPINIQTSQLSMQFMYEYIK